MVTADRPKSAFYLAKDRDRTIALTIKRDSKLFCYVPNYQAFVYNKPLSVDFLIDRNNRYDRINSHQAAQIIHGGLIGRINDRSGATLMEWADSEPLRIDPKDAFDAEPAGFIDQRTAGLISTDDMMAKLLDWRYTFGEIARIDGVATDAWISGDWDAIEMAFYRHEISADEFERLADHQRNPKLR